MKKFSLLFTLKIGILLSKLLCEKKNILVIKRSFLRSLEQFIYLDSERSEQFLENRMFLTSTGRFLRSTKLEQLEFKLEKNIGIEKHAGTLQISKSLKNSNLDR